MERLVSNPGNSPRIGTRPLLRLSAELLPLKTVCLGRMYTGRFHLQFAL